MALSKLAVRRLTKLADFLAALPKDAKKKFWMGRWFDHNEEHEHKFGEFIKPGDLKHCGTTACALGWAATIPSLYRAGLRIKHYPAGFRGTDAPVKTAAEFFNIDMGEAMYLFFDVAENENMTPKQWAAVCRNFVSENR
jgi:hypothetical protein